MFGTYQRLGVHVMASDLEVIRAARKKLARGAFKREHRAFRRDFYAAMLRHHEDARRVFYAALAG
jgi:hypothetical protein